MNKKLINKQFFASIKDVPDDYLNPDFIKSAGTAIILRFQYKQFIMFYPVSTDTAKGKTKAQLFAVFIKQFIKHYNEVLLTKEYDEDYGIQN